MAQVRCVLLFLVLQIAGVFLPLTTFAQIAPAGYTDNVEHERAQRFYEVYLFAPSPPETNLQNAIFNPLTKEFQRRYIEKFGVVDSDSLN